MNTSAGMLKAPRFALLAGRAGEMMRIAQLGALHLLVFALPLMEAPKNIACGLIALFWLLRAALTRDLGGRWDRFDTAFALALAVAFISAIRNQYFLGIADVSRVLLVAWIVKRSAVSRVDAARLLFTATIGLWLALGQGYVDYNAGRTPYLQLPSVGHVNQSSLYLTLLALLTFYWALSGTSSRAARIYVAVSTIFFGVSLLVTASRAALLAYVVALVLLAARHFWRRGGSWRGALAAAALLLAVVAGGFVASGSMRPDAERLRDKLLVTGSVAQRVQHWQLALEGWRASPWLGLGPESFRTLTPERGCAWRAARSEPCHLDDYSAASHPHNLYFGALVERGALGFIALLFFLWIWSAAVLRAGKDMRQSLIWAAAASALIVVIVGGLFNTTMRVEHGTLALLMLALWLASSRAAGSDAGTTANQGADRASDAAPGQHQPR